ncbi:putative Uncharacterized protein family (UPF0160) [Trypanosoma vivax]|uniref:Metal binding protein n=1 Tax=Trypanosoma vivax (strain Y486) TaxID=1055687 RepID=G0U8H1_TRYVY|nr:hypothetical protein TRVL_02542 [Trypanosoma vivax]KAH8605158.1 putative Uncharacterized protein family (UPF0160) [Trypanosoma vivax]CCC53897.1 conserved hypothetical protein [Trypanosoma vivax Y486]
MSRAHIAEFVKTRLCGIRVLESLADATAAALPVIGTHNGSFHCDEVLSCGMLRCTTQFSTASIVRTRDARIVDGCNIVVDVGGVYDAEALRLDHHQPSFQDTMTTQKATYKTRLSSAGLVYKHFGREIIQGYVEAALTSPYRPELLRMGDWDSSRKKLTERELETVFDAVYRNFVEHIDGIDNGVNAYGPSTEALRGMDADPSLLCVRNYAVTTTLSDRIGAIMPWWNEEGNGDLGSETAAFLKAVDVALLEFIAVVHYYVFAWLPARVLVEDAFLSSDTVHPSGRIVALRERFCPWKDHLLEMEAAHNKKGHVLYVLFADKSGWRVQAVPKDTSSFDSRKPLPWRGLRDAELSEASGIDGCVFVHASGFIGGNRTYEGALQMAVKALSAV